MQALHDAGVPSDPRVGPSATYGKDWLRAVHERQLQRLAQRRERDGTPGKRSAYGTSSLAGQRDYRSSDEDTRFARQAFPTHS